MKLRELLQEGGWASAETQKYQPTPVTVKKIIPILKKFEKDFNQYLKDKNMMPVKVGSTVGSSRHFEKDLSLNPEKEYGDIDVIFVLPRIEGLSENKISTVYQDLIRQFIRDKKPAYLFDDGAERGGQNILVRVNGEIHQVDLVKAFPETEDWSTHRMTPQHGLKGAFMGFLYASLAEILNLSIGSLGVQVKHVGNEIVPFKKLKVDRVNTITLDIRTFARDIFDYFFARAYPGRTDPIIPATLEKNPGMKTDEIKFTDLVASVKALADAFAENDMFGKGDLTSISSKSDFIQQIKNAYGARANEAMVATKFDKATTEKAKKRAEETKNTLKTQTQELLKLF